ncbi:hypothetical protein Ancab_000173 [Ancistrocladus abbreviatus]
MAASHQQQLQQQEQEEVDYFDLLPDPVLLLIFNKIFDAKSLCRCLSVSKRFQSLITQVDSMSIQIGGSPHASNRSKSSKSLARTLIHKFISKPLHFLHQIVVKKSDLSSFGSKSSVSRDVFHWMTKYLKNFSEVESLRLELSCQGGRRHGSEIIAIQNRVPLLKWNAEFGKELQRCVILGATSFEKRQFSKEDEGIERSETVATLSHDDLKSRIVWIIYCLLAASARHCLLKKMAIDCPKLKDAVIVDSSKQGKLLMKEDQIKDLMNSMDSSMSSDEHNQIWQRNCVPDLMIKLWYVNELELPRSEYVMKGATLVAVRPSVVVDGKFDDGDGDDDSSSVLKGCFDGGEEGEEVFAEAIREMMKRKEKKTYKLEMNSF